MTLRTTDFFATVRIANGRKLYGIYLRLIDQTTIIETYKKATDENCGENGSIVNAWFRRLPVHPSII